MLCKLAEDSPAVDRRTTSAAAAAVAAASERPAVMLIYKIILISMILRDDLWVDSVGVPY